jgi:hypothetical protein
MFWYWEGSWISTGCKPCSEQIRPIPYLMGDSLEHYFVLADLISCILSDGLL